MILWSEVLSATLDRRWANTKCNFYINFRVRRLLKVKLFEFLSSTVPIPVNEKYIGYDCEP